MQQQEGSDTSGTVAGTGQVAKQMSWEPDTDQYFPEMANMVFEGLEPFYDTCWLMWWKVVFIKQHVQNGRRTFVIPSGYRVFSGILIFFVVEMDQNGQIIRYWDIVLIGASMIALKNQHEKK